MRGDIIELLSGNDDVAAAGGGSGNGGGAGGGGAKIGKGRLGVRRTGCLPLPSPLSYCFCTFICSIDLIPRWSLACVCVGFVCFPQDSVGTFPMSLVKSYNWGDAIGIGLDVGGATPLSPASKARITSVTFTTADDTADGNGSGRAAQAAAAGAAPVTPPTPVSSATSFDDPSRTSLCRVTPYFASAFVVFVDVLLLFLDVFLFTALVAVVVVVIVCCLIFACDNSF